MPPKAAKDVGASKITRVLVKSDGWIDIQPGSFKFGALDFWYDPADVPPIHTGLSYLGFTFKNKTGDKSYCVPTDGIAAIEVQEG